MQCNSSLGDLTLLDNVLEEYKTKPGSLVTVLQEAQELFGCLPPDVIYKISDSLQIPPARVFGVATFYTQFRFSPVGKYLILLCQGTACHVNGSKKIEDAIREELGISDGQTSDDGLFTLTNVACLGCCSLSPVMMINDETYGNLTPDQTKEIIRSLKEVKE
ncbi:MAG: NADH-quinone oxidoreductase subunit NuoE [Clostridiales bacterium]|nr:NADH-quinone oxidoreductase subunit NuoE [Clostridiales bacterium]